MFRTLLESRRAPESPVAVGVVSTGAHVALLTAALVLAHPQPRAAATTGRIEEAVLTAAAGGGVLPPKMLGELLRQIERIQREVLSPSGLHTSGLTPREIGVLRLMSEGLDTAEIAVKMCLSERAVKRVIFGVTRRLNLRNRPHAVAYALRSGVI